MMRSLSSLLGVLATLQAVAWGSQEAQVPILGNDFVCEHPPYKVHKVSSNPLIIYIEGFLTEQERLHLQAVTEDKYARSAIATDGKAAKKSVRTSQSTYAPRDALVRCIEERAVLFQGYDVPTTHLEPLQLVKYAPSERYAFHTDWFADPAYDLAANGGNRMSSFFAYVFVRNDTTGGGTNFPLVAAPRDERWCAVVDCDESWDKGVTFRPIEGNAVYWDNLDAFGRGNQKVMHAGLPVVTGEKIGMNIWTRQAPLSEEERAPMCIPQYREIGGKGYENPLLDQA